MMDEQKTIDFATQLATRLATDEDLDAILAATLARVAEIDVAHFQAWARQLVDHSTRAPNMSAYRKRLQTLNVRLAEEPAFIDAVRRFRDARVCDKKDPNVEAQRVIGLVTADKRREACEIHYTASRVFAEGTPERDKYHDTLVRGWADATDARTKAQLRALADIWFK